MTRLPSLVFARRAQDGTQNMLHKPHLQQALSLSPYNTVTSTKSSPRQFRPSRVLPAHSIAAHLPAPPILMFPPPCCVGASSATRAFRDEHSRTRVPDFRAQAPCSLLPPCRLLPWALVVASLPSSAHRPKREHDDIEEGRKKETEG